MLVFQRALSLFYLFIYFFHFFIFLFFFRGHFLIKTREGFLLRKIRFLKQLQLLFYFRGCIILYHGLYSIVFYGSFKGNPNFQSILDWILQILHYCFRKQHKNIENWWIIEQNLVLSLPFSLFTATCASCRLPQRVFSFLEHSTPQILNVTGDHSCRT